MNEYKEKILILDGYNLIENTLTVIKKYYSTHLQENNDNEIKNRILLTKLLRTNLSNILANEFGMIVYNEESVLGSPVGTLDTLELLSYKDTQQLLWEMCSDINGLIPGSSMMCLDVIVTGYKLHVSLFYKKD